jgi:hypothetical protein
MALAGPWGAQPAGTAAARSPVVRTSAALECCSGAGRFVIEFEERWTDSAGSWYSRQMAWCEVRGSSISRLSLHCTGDWSEARQAQHHTTVRLLEA